jgi:hypothetical protein
MIEWNGMFDEIVVLESPCKAGLFSESPLMLEA